MAKRDLTGHQRKIVDRYYEHRDTIMVHKLGELVGELYLCESDKKAEKLWKSVETAMGNLGATRARERAILEERDLGALAKLVGELNAKA